VHRAEAAKAAQLVPITLDVVLPGGYAMDENQFGVPDIENSELGRDEVPRLMDDWTTIFRFALSYDGYTHHADQCAHIANAAAHRYSQEGELPESPDELRTCLFFEQRRWHHFGATPDGEARRYFAALLEAIRAKAHAAGES